MRGRGRQGRQGVGSSTVSRAVVFETGLEWLHPRADHDPRALVACQLSRVSCDVSVGESLVRLLPPRRAAQRVREIWEKRERIRVNARIKIYHSCGPVARARRVESFHDTRTLESRALEVAPGWHHDLGERPSAGRLQAAGPAGGRRRGGGRRSGQRSQDTARTGRPDRPMEAPVDRERRSPFNRTGLGRREISRERPDSPNASARVAKSQDSCGRAREISQADCHRRPRAAAARRAGPWSGSGRLEHATAVERAYTSRALYRLPCPYSTRTRAYGAR